MEEKKLGWNQDREFRARTIIPPLEIDIIHKPRIIVMNHLFFDLCPLIER